VIPERPVDPEPDGPAAPPVPDEVEEADEESFPASDPPGSWAGGPAGGDRPAR